MNVQTVAINKIKPYDKNPRKNDAAVDKVAASIKEFGFQQPIVVGKDGIIIVGHTRLKAAKKLGITEVPVLYTEDLTDEQVKAYRLADNKTNEFAEWDYTLLGQELGELESCNFDMEPFGFEHMDNDEAQEDDFDVDAAVDEISEPITKLGDIWQLGRHRLMCGDSANIDQVKQLVGGKLGNLIVTDPPYNVAYEGKTKDRLTIKNDNIKADAFRKFLTDAFVVAFQAVETGSGIYVFHADSEGYNFRGAFCDAGFKLAQTCIWVKSSMVIGRQDYQWQHEPILCGEKEDPPEEEEGEEWEPIIYGWNPKSKHNWHSNRKQKTVWYFDKPVRSKEHPTMKPIKLIAYPIQNSSVPGNIILDLFGGSGSTLIACEQLNRICYMMELDEKYCDVIKKRWEEFTRQKAEFKS
ncbi:MAG: DNA modification methylase [Desulfosporosinus sp.]